ncbi:MAG: acetyl-CoA hydrolase/transferase family protein [Anaerotignaceae bacterium]
MVEYKNWKEIYASKLIDAKEAITHIKNGDRVITGNAVAEPGYLIDVMVENYQRFKNVEICHVISLGKGHYTKPEMKGHFHFNGLFLSAPTREAVNNGTADFTTSFLHEMPTLFSDYIPADVALIMVSKPDKHGFCSFGTSCDYTKPMTESAKLVIAQVNEKVPRTLGDNHIHVRDIDYIVEHNSPIIEVFPAEIGEVEYKIGEYCASLIKDGDTLQLGIGSIPESVLTFLGDRKDLGLHTELASNGIIPLIKAGIINNKRKRINRGKNVVSFVMGTQELYDFVDDNPDVLFYDVTYVNNPPTIAQNDNVVSINSCLQVDLMGQVVSECVGLKQFSGVGGQVDFVRGATMSKGGRAIIAMPSTASGGKISRITPFLEKGAAVTTSRNDVNYIVTEYGIAQLKGKTLKDRAKALIEIAHPDFREELKVEFQKRFLETY